MMNTNLLKAEIVKNGLTQKEFCKSIKMAQSTFIRKIRKGVFNTKRPEQIFFGKN